MNKVQQPSISLGLAIRNIQKEAPLMTSLSYKVNRYGTFELLSLKIIFLFINKLINLAKTIDLSNNQSLKSLNK